MTRGIFGELYYDDYGWCGETTIDWFGEDVTVDLIVSGEENEEIDSLQCDSYKQFMAAWDRIRGDLLDSVLAYYTNLRYELGYDDGSNESYPYMSTAEEMKNAISLDAIVAPPSDIYDGRSIALAFSCDWNDEDGLGVVLVNETVFDVGYQDIAF